MLLHVLQYMGVFLAISSITFLAGAAVWLVYQNAPWIIYSLATITASGGVFGYFRG